MVDIDREGLGWVGLSLSLSHHGGSLTMFPVAVPLPFVCGPVSVRHRPAAVKLPTNKLAGIFTAVL